MAALAALLAAAGLPAGLPAALATVDASGFVDQAVSGIWPGGAPVVAGDRFYLASLAKQVTGAMLAVLVRDGGLDPDAPVAAWLEDLPGWSREVTPRQLAHHIAGLPGAGSVADDVAGDWTGAAALAALRRLETLPLPPGTAYVYSNLGYILLAQLIEAAAGAPFARSVDRRLFAPPGLSGIGFLETGIGGLPQAPLLGRRLPLSHGDGGLWASAPAFAGWLAAQNRDVLGLAGLVTAPGRLADGRTVDYGWGIGLRRFRGEPLFLHGGDWPGAVARAVRCPTLGVAVVAMAAGASQAQLSPLVAAALEGVAGG